MNTDQTTEIVQELMASLAAGALEISFRSALPAYSFGSQRRGQRKGPGLEHHGFREYDPANGDQASHIDPVASAIESEDDAYVVRLYRSPPLTCLTVLLDVGLSMNQGTVGTFKSLLGALCAGCGIKCAEKIKDKVSFITFADQPITIMKMAEAQRSLMPALFAAVEDRLLAQIGSSIGGGLSIALKTAQQRSRGVVLLVSDFANMNEEDWEALRYCGLKHDTIAVFVQDRRERELPCVPWPGMHYSLQDYQGKAISFWVAPDNGQGKFSAWFLQVLRRIFGSVTTAREYSENFRRYEESILERLADCGVSPLIVSTEAQEKAVHELLQLLASKARL